MIEAEHLELESLERGRIHQLLIHLVDDAAGGPISIPVLVARGVRPGLTLGITAAVHGNELNGIPAIHRLFGELDPTELKGTVVGVPVVNLPAFLRHEREFVDGTDINRIMPGRPDGNVAEVYAHRFATRVMHCMSCLIDLHTASFGRANSLYVRADMDHPRTAKLARLINPQIIVHNPGADGTLRGYAEESGISAITVEIGDPHRFQRGLIRSSRLGIQAILGYLDMYDDEQDALEEETIECVRSYWIYSDAGGVLRVFPDVATLVQQGERIASVTNLFGELIREYFAPEAGVVIGKSTNPVGQTGARILHLGIVR